MGMRMLRCVPALYRVIVAAASLGFNLNGAVTNFEIMFEHVRHIMKNLLTFTDALIRYHDVAATCDQT